MRVVVFYILTFVFTIVVGGIQEAAGLAQTSIILPQWGPGLAGLAMLLVFRKDRLRITFFDRHVPASRYLLAALIPIGGAVLIYLIYRLFFGAPAAGAPTATPWILLLWFPLGAVGEELGWRGYLHNRLNADMVGLASSVIVGTLWAFWHVGSYQNGMLYTLFFMLLMISYTVVIYAVVSRIGFNVLVAAIFHLMINVGNLFSYAVVNRVDFLMVSSLVWAAIADRCGGDPETAVRDKDENEVIMKAIVVYESHWGNTAAIARRHCGRDRTGGTRRSSTAEATGEACCGRRSHRGGRAAAGLQPADGGHAGSMGSRRARWTRAARSLAPGDPRLAREALPRERRPAGGFEERASGGRPAAPAKAILGRLERAGYRAVAAKAQRFVVKGEVRPAPRRRVGAGEGLGC